MEFLKNLLAQNKFEVMVSEDAPVGENSPKLFTVGVTDLVFNPVIAVYEMSLKTEDGRRVSPAYWDQKTTECVDEYWL